MFPLRTARSVAEFLDCSADHIHDLWSTGQLPYVLLPPSLGGRSNPETEGRRRRMRADHLRLAILDWTHE